MLPYLLFLAGLVLLTLAGDALVRGAVTIATRFHVPPLIIGLTIISMGTSAPELFVSIQAAFNHAPGLAVGNAIGSNIANSLIVLGLPALIAPLHFTAPGIKTSSTFMLAITVGFLVLALDGFISFADGLALIFVLIIYLSYSIIMAKKARHKKLQAKKTQNIEGEEQKPASGMGLALAYLGFGFIGLGIGAKLIVESAMELANLWGVGETVVGTTIVAFGTTLPEIAATLAAAFRREAGVAIGNVIGSNIFNILGILGITSMLIPLPVSSHLLAVDIWVLLGTALLIIPIAYMRKPLGRIFGAGLSLAYCLYLYISFAG